MSDELVPAQRDRLDSFPILTTKLYRPPITSDLEPRADLLERLNQNHQRPLTLISAPAGYGKTTLASMWLQASNGHSAWVSLDEGDNDLGTFTSYLVAAVQRVFPDAMLETRSLLQAPAMPPAPVVARCLLNDLEQIEEPFVLALDDVYMIHEQAIFDLLNELLRHPSPMMHLLLITRRDPPLPIATLRARRQITEVRSRDLRFTVPEAKCLLSKMLQREVDETTAAEWTKHTEGWVTALQLVALSLTHRDRGDVFNDDIPLNSRYLQDYLLAEVLAHLDPVRQERLLATSLLDRFCGPLCEAVWPLDAGSDEDAYTGEGFVRWLQDQNLFLIPLDDQGQWFRYHHLFQHLLQQSLNKHAEADEIAAIHRRASHWLAEKGLIGEALRHLLASGDVSVAVQLVDQHRFELMNAERWRQLESWIGWFPHEAVASDPILSISKAIVPSTLGRGETFVCRDQARRLIASMTADSFVAMRVGGEIACLDAMEGMLSGRADIAITAATQALELLPAEARHLRYLAVGIQGIGYQMSGNFDRGNRVIQEALSDPRWPLNTRAKLYLSQAFVCFMEGDLTAVQVSAGESQQLAMQYKSWDTSFQASYLAGIAHYLRNELAMAEPHLLTLVDAPVLVDPNYLAHASCALARVYHAQKQPERANDILRQTGSYLEETGSSFSLVTIRAFQVELALDQGDIATARRLSLTVDFDMNRPVWYHYVIQLTPIRLLIAEGTVEGLKQALSLLEQMDEQLLKMNRKVSRIDVLTLRALAHDAQGDWQEAGEKLSAALSLAEPGGFIRNFVDLGPPMADLLSRFQRQYRGSLSPSLSYITRILAAFPYTDPTSLQRESSHRASQPLPQSILGEPLTRRELQTIRLLATDLSPLEIARQMGVSVATVRTHTKNIYSKLDVHSRFEAVYRARELDLL